MTLEKTDLAAELMEEDETVGSEEKGLTEIIIKLEGMEVKTLVDTGSEVSVVAESLWIELKKINRDIPMLPAYSGSQGGEE